MVIFITGAYLKGPVIYHNVEGAERTEGNYSQILSGEVLTKNSTHPQAGTVFFFFRLFMVNIIHWNVLALTIEFNIYSIAVYFMEPNL